MSELEIFQLKAVIDSDDSHSSHLIQVLERLRVMDLPSVTILKKTLIGKSIKYLASRTVQDEVRALAREIEKNWRRAFRSRESLGNFESKLDPQAPVQSLQGMSASRESVKETKPAGVDSIAKTTGGEVHKRRVARDGVCKLLTEALRTCFEEHAAQSGHDSNETVGNKKRKSHLSSPSSLAAQIEDELHSQLASDKEYRTQARAIAFNLKDEKNIAFRMKLVVGDIAPGDLPRLSAEQMASDARKELRRKLRLEAMDAVNDGKALDTGASGDGLFPCEQCFSTKTTNFQLPTTNPDVAPTIVVSCSSCGHRWSIQDKEC